MCVQQNLVAVLGWYSFVSSLVVLGLLVGLSYIFGSSTTRYPYTKGKTLKRIKTNR